MFDMHQNHTLNLYLNLLLKNPRRYNLFSFLRMFTSLEQEEYLALKKLI